jgi:diguanylate cyclase (GGDEF)-like protein
LSVAGYLSVFLAAGLTDAFWVLVFGTMLGWTRRGFRGVLTLASVALMALSLYAAAAVYRGSPGPKLGVLLFAVTFLVMNHIVVDLYYWLRDGHMQRGDILRSLGWDGVGWGLSIPLVAIYVLLHKSYGSAWWIAVLALIVYGSVTLLLTFYFQTRVSHAANRRMAAAAEGIAAATDRDKLAASIVNGFRDLTGFKTFVLYLKDPATKLMVRTVEEHPAAEVPYPEIFEVDGEGLTSWAVVARLPEFVADSRKLKKAASAPDDAHPIVSGFILPLVADRVVHGIIAMGRDYPNGYTRLDFEMAKVLAQHAALAYRKWTLQQEAVHLSRVDPLLPTVYNYRYFRELLDERIGSYGTHSMALAFLDIDNFKRVNDQHGHVAGDMVLQKFSELVVAELRERDIFARYGGDEFLVLLDNVDEEGAAAALIRIQERLESARWLESGASLGVSAGFALFPNDGETAEILLNQADLRMYGNKMARKALHQIMPST